MASLPADLCYEIILNTNLSSINIKLLTFIIGCHQFLSKNHTSSPTNEHWTQRIKVLKWIKWLRIAFVL